MKRIAIFGLPGTGKSTLGVQLSRLLGITHHDLDSVLFTNTGARPLEDFRGSVAAITGADEWITDGNYSKLRDITCTRPTR